MTNFLILPLKGVGEIRFGMSPDEVRGRIGAAFRSFMRSPQASFPCDYFADVGAFCYYDSDGRLEAIEFSPPARPTIQGVELLGLGFEAAQNALSALDNQVENEIDGAIAYKVGVSIYAPLAKDDPAAPVESVLAFRPGYYSQR